MKQFYQTAKKEAHTLISQGSKPHEFCNIFE